MDLGLAKVRGVSFLSCQDVNITAAQEYIFSTFFLAKESSVEAAILPSLPNESCLKSHDFHEPGGSAARATPTVLWSCPGWISRDLQRRCSIFPPLKLADTRFLFFCQAHISAAGAARRICADVGLGAKQSLGENKVSLGANLPKPQIQQDNSIIHVKMEFHL